MLIINIDKSVDKVFMYLTDISHDFDFHMEKPSIQNVYKLRFKRKKPPYIMPWLQNKIVFHTNQGRETYLQWSINKKTSQVQYHFVIKNVIHFYWSTDNDIVYYYQYKSVDNMYVKYWLLHTFLPLYYVIEHKYQILHAGAVLVEGNAVLFAAPSFGGKSTLTHHFLTKGHSLVSDDKLAIIEDNGVYQAIPSYPYARNYRALEDLGEYVENFAKKSTDISAVYRLKKLDKEASICIKKVHGIAKFTVMEMCHDMKLSMLKKETFSNMHAMAKNIDIYEIGIPQDIQRLEEVYTFIVAHNKILRTRRKNDI